MPKIDRWVIETTFAWVARQKQAEAPIPLLSINLSAGSLVEESLLTYLLETFERDIDPAIICFEITESLAVSSYLRTNDFIGSLRKIGCQFSIDDFGSGFCSYAYLKQLDFDYIKIDGLFVLGVPENSFDQAVVRSINEISHLLGKKTVAEFVETEAILSELESIGVDFAQGNDIHQPVALEDIRLKPAPILLCRTTGSGSK